MAYHVRVVETAEDLVWCATRMPVARLGDALRNLGGAGCDSPCA